METPALPFKRAIVVGASSGIGEAVARELVLAGARVALVARRREILNALVAELNGNPDDGPAFAVPADVRETALASGLLQEAATLLGGLDLVVYAAGIMPPIGSHEYPTERDVDTVSTNLSGAIGWLNAAAERFALAGEGTIVAVSSVAGDRGRAGNPAYNASKAGLDVYLASLRVRLARRGVNVVTVKPGYVRTAITADLALPRFLPVLAAHDAALQLLAAAAAGKRVVYLPPVWRLIMTVIRAIPAPLFERLSL